MTIPFSSSGSQSNRLSDQITNGELLPITSNAVHDSIAALTTSIDQVDNTSDVNKPVSNAAAAVHVSLGDLIDQRATIGQLNGKISNGARIHNNQRGNKFRMGGSSGDNNWGVMVGAGNLGALYCYGNIKTSANSFIASDDRLKHNEIPVENALHTMLKLKAMTYDKTTEMREEDFMGDISGPHSREVGFIAQEVLKIDELKNYVSGGDYEQDGKLVQDAYALNYTAIFSINVAATQELHAIVQAQAATIANLEQRLAALEA